jgi:hypothetical protein
MTFDCAIATILKTPASRGNSQIRYSKLEEVRGETIPFTPKYITRSNTKKRKPVMRRSVVEIDILRLAI